MRQRDNQLPKKTTYVFEEIVFSTVDIERGQFVEISPPAPYAPVVIGQQTTIVNRAQEIPGGSEIKG